jgi:hypothetical protein
MIKNIGGIRPKSGLKQPEAAAQSICEEIRTLPGRYLDAFFPYRPRRAFDAKTLQHGIVAGQGEDAAACVGIMGEVDVFL